MHHCLLNPINFPEISLYYLLKMRLSLTGNEWRIDYNGLEIIGEAFPLFPITKKLTPWLMDPGGSRKHSAKLQIFYMF